MRSKLTLIAAILAVFYVICVCADLSSEMHRREEKLRTAQEKLAKAEAEYVETEEPGERVMAFIFTFGLSEITKPIPTAKREVQAAKNSLKNVNDLQIYVVCATVLLMIGAILALVGYFQRKNKIGLIGVILYGIAYLLLGYESIFLICFFAAPVFGFVGFSPKRRWATMVAAILYSVESIMILVPMLLEDGISLVSVCGVLLWAALGWIAYCRNVKWPIWVAFHIHILACAALLFLMFWIRALSGISSNGSTWRGDWICMIIIFVLGLVGYIKQVKKVEAEPEEPALCE